ncbi:DNA mismatch repair protein MutS [Halobacteriales archaeon QS_8_69_26]|nr:MAG: DNA mismatch repair protein MutS [Halobacteriales archaeon QS_8_69_26]
MTEAEGIVGEYFALKREAGADLLAMQVGDFYEFFDEDAELVGEELDLKISQKGSAGDSYPMAGVPVDDLTPYVKALVERGYRVAVADQHETADGHARAVTRVATPGTLLETTDTEARYLATVVREGEVGGKWGLTFADVTTGRFLVTDAAGADAHDEVLSELYRFDPAEVLPGPDVRNDDDFLARVRERTDASLTLHETRAFEPGRARRRTSEQFGDAVESVGLDPDGAAVRAAGAALDYVEETGTGVLASMTRITPYRGEDHVTLDATTQRNLELTEPMTEGGRTLLETVDHTVTSPGSRTLAEWLTRPRRDRAVLRERHDAVEALAAAPLDRERIREVLSEVYDLERLASRAASGSAGPRDLLAARDTLAVLPDLAGIAGLDPVEGGGAASDGEDRTAPPDTGSDLSDSPLPAILNRPDRRAAAELRGELAAALAEDPAASPGEGGVITRGYDADLDEVIDRHEELKEWFDSLADREKAKTGITHLSVGRNKTDGYYLQVGKSETDAVPDRYEPVKTLKNSERFTTTELEEREREVLRLEERRGEMETEIFDRLRERVADRAELLQDVGRALATVDVLGSLATHAVENDWTRPELGGGGIDVRAGRHPVVEGTTDFVPNDARLDDERSFLIVTGPNMSGKSTYMRQTALITLLAQVGSFVPAESAEIDPVDGVFTRVGALDELAGGRSTFMVEMEELSNILHAATEDSLVILDEVGRGTATFDGISIAWAATEYLHNEVRAKTLFATHYHELTTMAEHLDRVANVHVAADERDGTITFLRTVRDGPTDRSYGIHVADLAGVPEPVVDRARDVLDRLRREKAIEARGAGGSTTQQVVFDVSSGEMRPASAADGSGGAGSGGKDHSDGTGTGSGGPGGSSSDTGGPPGSGRDGDDAGIDPEAREVLDALADLDVEETPPVELLATVQEWQRRIDDE